jgi:hypothetical protein
MVQITQSYMARGLLVWLGIIVAESVHGTLRQLFLAPALGDFNARRASFFTGILLIFVVSCYTIRWIGARNRGSLLAVGLLWAVLTMAFEMGLGFLVLGYSAGRIFEDYDLTRGGLMGFGMGFMLLAPMLAAWARGLLPASKNEQGTS